MRRSVSFLIVAVFLFSVHAAAADDLIVEFADPAWDGNKIPDGQICEKFGGHGSTPPLTVSNIPAEANAIVVEFNDRNSQRLSWDGGHGKVGFIIEPGVGTATLPPVLGGTNDMPEGVWLEKKNRATGAWFTPGYIPPCSGGKNNMYEAEVYAVVRDADGDYDEIAEGEIQMGRY